MPSASTKSASGTGAASRRRRTSKASDAAPPAEPTSSPGESPSEPIRGKLPTAEELSRRERRARQSFDLNTLLRKAGQKAVHDYLKKQRNRRRNKVAARSRAANRSKKK